MEETSFRPFYEELGLYPDATKEEIKEAYRKLSKLYHPDISETADADKFKRISDAYHMLLDPVYRYKNDLDRSPISIVKNVTLEQAIFGCSFEHHVHVKLIVRDELTKTPLIEDVPLVVILDAIPSGTTTFPISHPFYGINFGMVHRDVILQYQLEPHNRYKIYKLGGLIVDEYVDLYDCLKGNKISVETLFGKRWVQLSKCAKIGSVFEVLDHPVMPMLVRIAGHKLPEEADLKQDKWKKLED